MLHIATPLHRFELLEKIYESIPKHADITWHIAKSSAREKLKNSFIDTDKRVKVYEIDCSDKDTVAKRNTIFDQIDDGFFILLDDDTIFLDEAYRTYQKYFDENFVGMIVGKQKYGSTNFFFNRERSLTDNPLTTKDIDSGMVICHHSVLRKVRWVAEKKYANDFYFWSRCFAYFGDKSVIMIDNVISRYNYLRTEIRVRKKIFSVKIDFDIHHPILIRVYLSLIFAKSKVRKLLNLAEPKYTNTFSFDD